MAALGREGALGGGLRRAGLGVDKINILLQTAIGVLRFEDAALDTPYIVSWNPGRLRI